MPQCSKIYQKAYSKKVRLVYKQRITLVQNKLKETVNFCKQLTNKKKLRFFINKRSITLS